MAGAEAGGSQARATDAGLFRPRGSSEAWALSNTAGPHGNGPSRPLERHGRGSEHRHANPPGIALAHSVPG
jgi:hypothetical protein